MMVFSIMKLVVLIMLLFIVFIVKFKLRKKVVLYLRVRGVCEVYKGWFIWRDECDICILIYGCCGGCFLLVRFFSYRIGFVLSCLCCVFIKFVIIEIKVLCNG